MFFSDRHITVSITTVPSGGGIPAIPHHNPVTCPRSLQPGSTTTLPVKQFRCSPCTRRFCTGGRWADNTGTAYAHQIKQHIFRYRPRYLTLRQAPRVFFAKCIFQRRPYCACRYRCHRVLSLICPAYPSSLPGYAGHRRYRPPGPVYGPTGAWPGWQHGTGH